MPSTAFAACLAVLLAAPAVVHAVAAWHLHGQVSMAYFIGNYLFMAAPIALTALLALVASVPRRPLLCCLLAQWVALAVFQAWIIANPGDDDALLWALLYPPFSIAAAALCAVLSWLAQRYQWRQRRAV